MKLGTYTTFDAPTQKEDMALDFLREEFEKIGGNVRKILNPHDFGSYPSFEIDYPYGLETTDEDNEEEMTAKDDWHDKANEIEEKYNKKFEEYL